MYKFTFIVIYLIMMERNANIRISKKRIFFLFYTHTHTRARARARIYIFVLLYKMKKHYINKRTFFVVSLSRDFISIKFTQQKSHWTQHHNICMSWHCRVCHAIPCYDYWHTKRGYKETRVLIWIFDVRPRMISGLKATEATEVEDRTFD